LRKKKSNLINKFYLLIEENYSLSNNRPIQPRSTSASSGLTIKHESKNSSLTPNDIQRLKHIRRHEPAHIPSSNKSKIIFVLLLSLI
jgi:hypothetical protein